MAFEGSSKASRNSVENVVYFKGFDVNTTEATILSIFAKYGKVKKVHFGKDKKKVFLGHGTVVYDNQQIASNAIQATNGMIISGCEITVKQFVPKSDRLFNNIYVKNFKDDIVSEDELIQQFRRFGEITSSNFERDESGALKGFGYVCYANTFDAKKAVEMMNGFEFNSGNKLYVARHETKSERQFNKRQKSQLANNSIRNKSVIFGNEPFCNVFVKNFNGVIENEDQLRSVFSAFGEISSAIVMKDEHNQPRGCGFVCFCSSLSAERAVREMNGRKFNGKVLFVGRERKRSERDSELSEKIDNKIILILVFLVIVFAWGLVK